MFCTCLSLSADLSLIEERGSLVSFLYAADLEKAKDIGFEEGAVGFDYCVDGFYCVFDC